MREMRRSDRMITDREEIVDVLDSCKVFRMAVHDEEGMYIVPLNFGYTYEEDVLKLISTLPVRAGRWMLWQRIRRWP